MSPPAALISHLRSVGVTIKSKQGRLIVAAPKGVLTAEWREELARRKAELITALEERFGPNEDPAVTDARRKVVGLLAAAYRRYIIIQRARPGDSVSEKLANSCRSSVHGVVP